MEFSNSFELGLTDINMGKHFSFVFCKDHNYSEALACKGNNNINKTVYVHLCTRSSLDFKLQLHSN